jgi:GNAT superfamily N-acetyltransferase
MKHHYTIRIESFDDAFEDCHPLARMHYEEMRSRLEGQGIPIGPYNPRLDVYRRASRDGYLFTFVVRTETGEAVGYSNVYLQQDMHNSESYAREDTVYIHPDHRNGVGRRLVRFILDHMKEQGAKRFAIQPVTDLRVGKIWQRMGFRPVAETMILTF